MTIARLLRLLPLVFIAACHLDGGTAATPHATCALPGSSSGTDPLAVIGCGIVDSRYTAEVAVRDSFAYTTTWGYRSAAGNMIEIGRAHV